MSRLWDMWLMDLRETQETSDVGSQRKPSIREVKDQHIAAHDEQVIRAEGVNYSDAMTIAIHNTYLAIGGVKGKRLRS